MKKLTLTQGQVAIVDDEDFELLNKRKWSAAWSVGSKRFYATAKIPGSQKNERMHRFIMNAPKGMVVDHINNDPLDNRRANLRVCTQGENLQNIQKARVSKTGFRGLETVKRTNGKINYYAVVKVDGKRKFVSKGFEDPKEAALARDKAALEYYGPFAYQNFPNKF